MIIKGERRNCFPESQCADGGRAVPESVREIIESNRESVVVVDEAYVDFGAETALPLIREYDNVLVVRTFSKIPFHGRPAYRLCLR